MHNLIVAIYIQYMYKLHEISSIGYLAMAEGGKLIWRRMDGKTDGKTEGGSDIQCQTNIPPPSAVDNNPNTSKLA